MKHAVALPAALAVLIAFAPHVAQADAVINWNFNAGAAARQACLAPGGNALAEARLYAMVHVAIHDALNAISRRGEPYAYDGQADPGASTDAAVAAAAHEVLVAVIGQLQESSACIIAGTTQAQIDYAVALATVPDGPAKTLGIQVGQDAALAILQRRASDGSDAPLVDFNYPQGTEPGQYRFFDGVNLVFGRDWGKVTPFALKSSAQFRPGAPYPVSSKRYARDYDEVKRLGGLGDSVTPTERTAEETEIGLFWVESSPFAWNRLARTLAVRFGLDDWDSARLFGLLNLAMADGYIASWDTKFFYNFWRPVSAIREGDADRNNATEGDPTWTPLFPTYPFPDHDSGHAVQGGAAAQILKQFFHTDRLHFEVCSFSDALPAANRCDGVSPVIRSFERFSEAADENAASRIFIGIHFRNAVEEGVRHGGKIATWAVAHYLKPVH